MLKKKVIRQTAIVLFWLLVWQAGSLLVHNSIILVGPAEIIRALFRLLPSPEFWRSMGNTLWKIALGFLLAFFSGILLAGTAFRFSWFEELAEPVFLLARSVPVASFVVLLLIWIGSANLSIAIVFLMALPMIYGNMLQGLKNVPGEMVEMARVFHMKPWKQFLYIYRPAFLPFLVSGSRVALGMSWKSGVAAEIIGVPAHSIGERLYMSKIYLDTENLFAWTLVIILLSMIFEKVFLWLLKKAGGSTWEERNGNQEAE